MSGAPKFSIIVPTRNRARTLRHTLRTCLDQTFDSFEVIVSDNFSDDDTADVIASFADGRLRGVRTSSYISMSRNFANGLAQARGENVLFIGDDDGLLPFGLELLARCLDASPEVDAVRWRPASFWWPHARDYAFRFAPADFAQRRSVEQAADILPRVTHPQILNFFEMTGFTLYHGCWRRSVLDRAAAEGIDLFDGPIPDVLSSIYGLHFARACLCLEAPVSIMGVSGKSNGWATSAVAPTDDQKVMREDFAARSRRDYPDAPPITFSFCACSPYLGSLLSYWLRLHGSLDGFDHEAWRGIFLNQLVFLYGGDADLQHDYNRHVEWLAARGVLHARGISAGDIEECRTTAQRLPDFPPGIIPQRPAVWRLFAQARDAPKMSRVPMRREHGIYIGSFGADGDEFTVKDFADLYVDALAIPSEGIAGHVAGDATAWQRLALTGLERQRIATSGWGRPLLRRMFAVP